MYKGYKIIALCITKAYERRGFDFVKSINDAVTRKGWRLFVYHSCSDFYWGKSSEECDKTVFDLIDQSVIDGMIICEELFLDRSVCEELAKRALAGNIPVVIIGNERAGCVSVGFGYEKGFEQIVRHVVEYHHITDVFMIAGNKGNDFSERRIEIFKEVLAENHLTFSEDRLDYGDFWWGPTEEIMNRLYEAGTLPKAFICANDAMAVTVCNFLQKKGIRVPEEIIVTGFDGIEEAKFCLPPVTTCSMDFDRHASVIADIFDRKFAGAPVEDRYIVEFALDIYGSCGCENPHPPLNSGAHIREASDRFQYYQTSEQLFYSMSENVMLCNEPRQIIGNLEKSELFNLAVFVTNNCFDNSVNPEDKASFRGFQKEVTLLYYDGGDLSELPKKFDRGDVLCDFDRVAATACPLIFNALGFLGIPYGYVCFYFEPTYHNYCRIQQFVSALNYSVGGYRSVNYVRYLAKNIENIADHDDMTGLFNRTGFYKRIEKLAARRDGEYMSVALIDMDGLKLINDTYGHSSGDFAIRTIACAVGSIPMQDMLCGRFGGDEFVVCAVSDSAETAEALIVKSVRDYLEAVNRESGEPFEVSASIGVASENAGSAKFEQLFKLADDKMYEEKITKPNHRKR